MKVPMGPPPPRNPSSEPDLSPPPPPEAEPAAAAATQPPSEEPSADEPSAAPVPESSTEKPEEETNTESDSKHEVKSSSDLASSSSRVARAQVPYVIPEWSELPDQSFSFEVLKHGSIIEQLDVSKKGAYMFGRTDLCDFILDHLTISRFHAVLQFKGTGEIFLYDLGSTHGTFVNKNQIKKKEYTEIHVGDVIKFGMSSRLYILQGPTDLMPPEGDLERIREAKAVRQEREDRKASLLRAKREASLAEGVSWGISEDAIEDSVEDDTDEITWQNYKGQLTERQEKTKGKVLKRLEKITHMKKEIDSIRAKDISQGGLTQGQQTQIARNEQRITQLLEELENLEETLNDSIRESLGARTGNITKNSKKKGAFDEEENDDVMSDEDDFYDRTKPKKTQKQNSEQKSVETAETLLDKKDSLINEMENKTKLLEIERNKLNSNGEDKMDGGNGDDDLDAFMTGLSSQLVHDKIARIEKEITEIQEELEKTKYLLKIADPTGEAIKKRENLKSKQISSENNKPLKEPKINKIPQFKEPKKPSEPNPFKEPKLQKDPKISTNPFKEPQNPNLKQENTDSNNNKPKENEKTEKKPFIQPKPQWLGANKDNSTDLKADDVASRDAATSSTEQEEETDDFIDYKDRKTALNTNNQSEIEEAKPGLIIRKRKEPENNKSADLKADESESSVADAVKLLLKHERGLNFESDEELVKNEGRNGKKEKRVLGPEKPEFMEKNANYETWVPPEGQTGDGRTKLNERFGY
ncbi:hypothetical protein LUZ60_000136 [Juncus effusus]|nr:hypothetical protein LUZ60_000136 [Juncus effusus]